MYNRLKKELKKTIILIVSVALYIIFIRISNIRIPCFFHNFTGFLCPACGITRSIEALLNGYIQSAFEYNKALFILMPVILSIFLIEEIRYIKKGKRQFLLISKILLWCIIIMLLIFGFIRNIK